MAEDRINCYDSTLSFFHFTPYNKTYSWTEGPLVSIYVQIYVLQQVNNSRGKYMFARY